MERGREVGGEGLKRGGGNFLGWAQSVTAQQFSLRRNIGLALMLLKAEKCTSSKGSQNEESTSPLSTSQRKEGGAGIF